MTDAHDDLKSLQARWRKAESAEPPDMVDQAVLNAAQRQLPAKPASRLPWIGAAATACVVVIAATLVIQQDQPESEIDFDQRTKLESRAKLDQPASAESPAPAAVAEQQQEFHALRKASKETDSTRASEMNDEILADEAFSSSDSIEQEAEIAQMLEWLESGQYELLDDALEAFRKNYPDYPLPPELVDF